MSQRFDDRRSAFPSLKRTHDGRPLVFLDGPAGTQVPESVIDAVAGYYRTSNANTHGQFVTAMETDAMISGARDRVAALLGAPSGATVSFGANMTTLAFALSRALARTIRTGDEVVITQLDHEANRGPWLGLQDRGAVVREVRLRPDGTLDTEDLRKAVNRKTRLVAFGMASNALGTVNDAMLAREVSRSVGALLILDAVHFAPHFSIDVAALEPDALLCSAYKFYGPHVGLLYARPGLLEGLEPDRLRTQDQSPPHRIETGTLNHASIAGVGAAVEFLAGFGSGTSLRDRLVSAYGLIGSHERLLGAALHRGLSAIRGVKVYGTNFGDHLRAPTVSFTLGERRAAEVSRALGDMGICTWDGHFYAVRAIEVLGLAERGGVTRLGVSLYNTMEEVDRCIEAVRKLAS